jgi:hypothetical protein
MGGSLEKVGESVKEEGRRVGREKAKTKNQALQNRITMAGRAIGCSVQSWNKETHTQHK